MTKQIEALRRGLVVLDLLAKAGPHSLAALARASALPKPTLLRILATLEATGHVRRGLIDDLWRATTNRHPVTGREHLLAEICAPALDGLCQRVLWPSDVGVYRDGSIHVLETSRRLSPFLVNRTVAVGLHVLPTAMGRAILAFTPEPDRQAIIDTLAAQNAPYERAAHDPVAMSRLIEDVRAKGYGARTPGYFMSKPQEAAVSAIAVPVLVDGAAVAAVNISWITRAASEADVVATHLGDLQAVAASIAEDFATRIGSVAHSA